jgi:hypothetical protein
VKKWNGNCKLYVETNGTTKHTGKRRREINEKGEKQLE